MEKIFEKKKIFFALKKNLSSLLNDPYINKL